MKNTINLASFREAVHKTQREIADILKVGQSYVSEIESGKKNISKEKLNILIEKFGQEVCDKYMIEKIDERVMPTFYAPRNGGTQKFAHQINEGVNISPDCNTELTKKLEESQAELSKTREELERAQKRIDKLVAIIENLSRE